MSYIFVEFNAFSALVDGDRSHSRGFSPCVITISLNSILGCESDRSPVDCHYLCDVTKVGKLTELELKTEAFGNIVN